LQEDADLFSINYLHMGAPKVWYCVSPKDRGKFERMCQSMFPELHAHCHAFLRHKDILLSPSTLKNYGVEYMQVCFLCFCGCLV
jgi:jumonji domain-containing protein 2